MKLSRVLSVALATAALAVGAFAQQASLSVSNADAQFCYQHANLWGISKVVQGSTDNGNGTGNVVFTVTATKSSGPTTFTVYGGMTITNTGTAPAPLGNIVINLQRPNSVKVAGKNVPWVSLAANCSNAIAGDAATSAQIVNAASQEVAAANLLLGPNNYTTSGAKGTFVETAGSGALNLTDASNNSFFSLVSQPPVPVGGSITLLYSATFSTSVLPAAGTPLRVEALVTFANAGARGGSGATASGIDSNGDGFVENNVRTVPTRVTTPMAALEECNAEVSVADLFPDDVSTAGTVSVSNPTGFGSQLLSDTSSFNVSLDYDAGVDGGSVTNTAHLTSDDEGGTLNVIIGYNIDFTPIYATYVCCFGFNMQASATFNVAGFQSGPRFVTFGKGGYQANSNGVPANVINSNYVTVFSPAGLTIGVYDGAGPLTSARWDATTTGLTSVRTAMNGGGSPTFITADSLNSPSISGGALAKQTAALTLNVAFSGNVTSPVVMPAGFGSLVLTATGTSLDGLTVNQILALANTALSGPTALPTGYTYGTLATLIENINLSYDTGVQSAWAAIHLP